MTPQDQRSGIRDNLDRGSVGTYLQAKIAAGSELSIVSAYFTIYAYQALKPQLDQIKHLRFLFGEPRFISALDPEQGEAQHFSLGEDGLRLENQLQQKAAARECAA